MKLFNKKLMFKIIIPTFLVSIFAIPAYASDDNIDYAFTVKAYYGNSFSTESRYRQTTDPSNQWKVNLESSTEGTGTIMTFWLEKASDHTSVSLTKNVAQGSGDHYYWADTAASETDVYLGCENNNYTSQTYTVSGHWDEETD